MLGRLVYLAWSLLYPPGSKILLPSCTMVGESRSSSAACKLEHVTLRGVGPGEECRLAEGTEVYSLLRLIWGWAK